MASRYVLFATLLMGVLLGIAACNPGHVILEGRVQSYLRVAADFDAGVEYLTPVMQEAVAEYGGNLESAAMPGATPALLQYGEEALSKVENIEIQGRGRWAQATVYVPTEYGKEPVPMMWLRLGTTWYLYSGSGGEKKEYGEPPYFAD